MYRPPGRVDIVDSVDDVDGFSLPYVIQASIGFFLNLRKNKLWTAIHPKQTGRQTAPGIYSCPDDGVGGGV